MEVEVEPIIEDAKPKVYEDIEEESVDIPQQTAQTSKYKRVSPGKERETAAEQLFSADRDSAIPSIVRDTIRTQKSPKKFT